MWPNLQSPADLVTFTEEILNRPGALDISFHVIFLRILVSLNVFVISSVIRIWRSVRFHRIPTACSDQRITKKKDPFSCHKTHAQIFIIGLYTVAGPKNAKK